jgi:hypothetical protein
MEPVCYAIQDFQDAMYVIVENALHAKQTISITGHQQQETVSFAKISSLVVLYA